MLSQVNQAVECIDGTPVLRIRLTSPYDLHRAICIVEHCLEAINIASNQVSTLVISKTACPYNGEIVWIKKPASLISDFFKQ